ncbi:MAG: preprotein translocase subunit YajC [Nocardioides sp.]
MPELAQLLPIVAFAAIFWLLIIRPAQRRTRQLQAMQSALSLGDAVVTSSGIHGTVRELADDTVRLEVAPDVQITVERGAIGRLTHSGSSATAETEK